MVKSFFLRVFFGLYRMRCLDNKVFFFMWSLGGFMFIYRGKLILSIILLEKNICRCLIKIWS